MIRKGFTALAATLTLMLCISVSAGAMSSAERVQRIVDEANARIAAEVVKAQQSKKDDTAELIHKTNAIAARAMEQAEKFGGNVVCVYEWFYVDGVMVRIDPLKVAY